MDEGGMIMNQYDCAALAILALLIFGLVSIAVVVFMIIHDNHDK